MSKVIYELVLRSAARRPEARRPGVDYREKLPTSINEIREIISQLFMRDRLMTAMLEGVVCGVGHLRRPLAAGVLLF